MTNKIYIKISDTRLWILDYNFVCAIFFIPVTAYASVKIRKIRIAKKLERERRLKELEKLKELERLYRILKIAGVSVPCLVFLKLKILSLRGGSSVVIPGIDDCIDLETPSYVNEERILRFLNDWFPNLAIKGIIYITKEAFCYLVANEGLVDLPVVFLERIKIDGTYSIIKTFSEWAVMSIGVALGIGGVIAPHHAIVYFGFIWLHIHSIKILQPRVKDVNKITREYIPRIESRKDAIVFDAKKQPLPPVIEKSIKPVRIDTLYTNYEITEKKLVDVSKVSKLKNKFSDRRFKRSNRRIKKPGKRVYFSSLFEKWRNKGTNNEEVSIIDEMIIDEMLIEGILPSLEVLDVVIKALPKGALYWGYAIDRLRGKPLMQKLCLLYVSAIDLSLNPTFWNGLEKRWLFQLLAVPFSVYITIQVTIWVVRLIGKIIEALGKLVRYFYEQMLIAKKKKRNNKKKWSSIRSRLKDMSSKIRGGQQLKLEKNLTEAILALENLIEDPVFVIILIQKSKQKFFSSYEKALFRNKTKLEKNDRPIKLKKRQKLLIALSIISSFGTVVQGPIPSMRFPTDLDSLNKSMIVRNFKRKGGVEDSYLICDEVEKKEIKDSRPQSEIDLEQLEKNKAEFENSIGRKSYKLRVYSNDVYKNENQDVEEVIEKEILAKKRNERVNKRNELKKNQVQNLNKFKTSEENLSQLDEIETNPNKNQNKKLNIKIKND